MLFFVGFFLPRAFAKIAHFPEIRTLIDATIAPRAAPAFIIEDPATVWVGAYLEAARLMFGEDVDERGRNFRLYP